MRTQKRIAARILKTSPRKVKFSVERLADIKEAITKTDIRALISEKAVKREQDKGISRVRANKLKVQKSKGLRKGPGSKQGRRTAREPRKVTWMNKVRNQRKFLAELKKKELVSNQTYRNIYLKSKGGFFRSKRHIKIYLEDKGLFLQSDKK